MTTSPDNVAAWINHEDSVFISIIADFLVENPRCGYGFDVREDVLCVVKLK